VLITVIADETDEKAEAKLKSYNAGADVEALAWMQGQSLMDVKASKESTAALLAKARETAKASYLQTFCGSYAKVAAYLDEIAEIDGVAGVMMTFDDFIDGLDKFGRFVQPLMKSRNHIRMAA
jgi:pyrimidine oxygenase